ncbi:hypothetical protein HK102_013343 [Quaeritorhiza haematococci]|nr:hypothetical protein HK102_013343 [Quaeritorhiza haematococci]
MGRGTTAEDVTKREEISLATTTGSTLVLADDPDGDDPMSENNHKAFIRIARELFQDDGVQDFSDFEICKWFVAQKGHRGKALSALSESLHWFKTYRRDISSRGCSPLQILNSGKLTTPEEQDLWAMFADFEASAFLRFFGHARDKTPIFLCRLDALACHQATNYCSVGDEVVNNNATALGSNTAATAGGSGAASLPLSLSSSLNSSMFKNLTNTPLTATTESLNDSGVGLGTKQKAEQGSVDDLGTMSVDSGGSVETSNATSEPSIAPTTNTTATTAATPTTTAAATAPAAASTASASTKPSSSGRMSFSNTSFMSRTKTFRKKREKRKPCSLLAAIQKKSTGKEVLLSYIVSVIESARRDRVLKDKMTVVIDRGDTKEPPLNIVRFLITAFQKHYPDRLSKLYIFPTFSSGSFLLWGAAKGFLDPETLDKIHLREGFEFLHECIDREELLQCYGGMQPDFRTISMENLEDEGSLHGSASLILDTTDTEDGILVSNSTAAAKAPTASSSTTQAAMTTETAAGAAPGATSGIATGTSTAPPTAPKAQAAPTKQPAFQAAKNFFRIRSLSISNNAVGPMMSSGSASSAAANGSSEGQGSGNGVGGGASGRERTKSNRAAVIVTVEDVWVAPDELDMMC